MKKTLMMLMVAVSMLSIATTGYAAPIAPTMTLSTQGQSLIISWTPSQGATGYKLAYAQYPWQPWMTMDDIHYADMGTATNISLLLWEGAAYYAAVQAYDSQGSSDFSNIDYFVMGPPTPTWVDDDGDGYREVDGDCNDANPSVKPSAQEVCGDGIDQDCNGVDFLCPEDQDYDLDGYTESQGDCNDFNSLIKPGVTEICGNNIDENCDGDINCRTEWVSPVSAEATGFTVWGGTWYTGSASNAIDGNQITSWTLNGMGKLTVDLGSVKEISGVYVYWGGSVTNGNTANIYIDGRKILSEERFGATGNTREFNQTTGRYIAYETVALPHNQYLQIASWSEVSEFKALVSQ